MFKKTIVMKGQEEDRVVFYHHVDIKSMFDWEFVHYTHIKNKINHKCCPNLLLYKTAYVCLHPTLSPPTFLYVEHSNFVYEIVIPLFI